MGSNERQFDAGFSRRVFWVAVWLLASGAISAGFLGLANILLSTVIHDSDVLAAARTLIRVLFTVSLVILVVGAVFVALLVGIYLRSRKRPNP